MPKTLKNTFAVLNPNGGAVPIEVSDDLYERLDREFDSFTDRHLVSCHSFDADWPTWEIHPAGEELVCVLSGEARLVVDHGERLEEIALDEPLAFAIVPRNTWHTAKVKAPCTMLFITPGAGTENKDVEANNDR
ncbi:MAG: cupin domain-containing protein [Gammaproteobacteria bacterium]